MNLISLPRCGTFRTGLTGRACALLLLASIALALAPVKAHALAKVTFSWRGNPPGDFVVGYRLYYGTSSRYNFDGQLKSNFSYDYYIDFNRSERCLAANPDLGCEHLNSSELSCENLAGDLPSCTVYNLPGQTYYFAMTAYNTDIESDYTRELTPAHSGRWSVLQYVSTLPRHQRR